MPRVQIEIKHDRDLDHIHAQKSDILPKWKKENFPLAQLGIYGFQDMFEKSPATSQKVQQQGLKVQPQG